ncbi:MAG: carboxypeptidase regulatory-like domain-containing protein [Planctomycetes bacterium]|nr:carboxypeptidase regulatory-like domain-containing protein [Planctomycetota bacterium]
MTATTLLVVSLLGPFAEAEGEVDVRLRVEDADTGAPIFARAVLRDPAGQVIGSNGYRDLNGRFIPPEGWAVRLPAGEYGLRVDAGFAFAPADLSWTVAAPETKVVRLARWLRLRDEGWYAGGDHDHLNRDGSSDKNYGGTSVTMEFAAAAMASRGWDYFACGGGGAWIVDGSGACDAVDANNRTFQRGFETEPAAAAWNRRYGDRCFLWWNNEHVKGRFGHLWILGAPSSGIRFPYTDEDASAYWSFYDENWDPWQTDKDRPIGPYASRLGPLPPNFDCIRAWSDAGWTVIYAHPTRSWTSDGVHWSNIACAFPFDLLAGAPVGGFAVMGDRFDHPGDQALWFAALDEGFQVPGIAENDTVFGRPGIRAAPYTTFTCVPDMGERFDLAKLARAMARGRNVLSSGAFCAIDLDGTHRIGDTARAGVAHRLRIRAWASSDPGDAIAGLVVIAGGRTIADIEDARGRRTFETSIDLAPGNARWLIAKVLCARKPAAAITNPIYLRREGEPPSPGPLRASVTGRVTAAGRGIPAAITVTCWGREVLRARANDDGRYALPDVPVAAHLRFEHEGAAAERTIFLDDPDYRRIHHEIYGTKYVGTPGALGGCFPPDIFAQLRDMARHVVIDVDLAPAGEATADPPVGTRASSFPA